MARYKSNKDQRFERAVLGYSPVLGSVGASNDPDEISGGVRRNRYSTEQRVNSLVVQNAASPGIGDLQYTQSAGLPHPGVYIDEAVFTHPIPAGTADLQDNEDLLLERQLEALDSRARVRMSAELQRYLGYSVDSLTTGRILVHIRRILEEEADSIGLPRHIVNTLEVVRVARTSDLFSADRVDFEIRRIPR